MEKDKILIIESDNMYDLMDIRNKIIVLLNSYDIKYYIKEEDERTLYINNNYLLIDFKLKGEKINYEEYDMISSYELLQDDNLEKLIESFREGE